MRAMQVPPQIASIEIVRGKYDSISFVTNFVAFHFMKLKKFTPV